MTSRRLPIAAALVVGVALLVVASASSALGPYPSLGSCGVFPRPDASVPANARSLPDQRAWNQDVTQAPLDPRSGQIIDYINAHGGDFLHPDFGSPRAYGFPYKVVGQRRRRVQVNFTVYGDESDHGNYRIPLSGAGRGRRRVRRRPSRARLRQARCMLYELYRAFPRPEESLGRRRAA